MLAVAARRLKNAMLHITTERRAASAS